MNSFFETEKVKKFIKQALEEDIGVGDFSGLASIPENTLGEAKLILKDTGIIAGIDLAEVILKFIDPEIQVTKLIQDGDTFEYGTIGMIAKGKAQNLLKGERLLLNCLQRLSGIASQTAEIAQLIKEYNCKLLDTRKTTPNMRWLEKWAVTIGGGYNHRFGLYDMIMLKDNHIDFAGGIKNAINHTIQFLKKNNLDLKIEIETRSLDEVKQVLETGGVHRIMLDNFSINDMKHAVTLIANLYETEASGGINTKTIKEVAATGVNYISVGAITHSVICKDISFKVI